MSAMASQINSLTIVYSSVYSGANQRKHQSSASLAFVRVIHRWPVNSLHKGPVTRKMFPFDDLVMVRWPHHVKVRRSWVGLILYGNGKLSTSNLKSISMFTIAIFYPKPFILRDLHFPVLSTTSWRGVHLGNATDLVCIVIDQYI